MQQDESTDKSTTLEDELQKEKEHRKGTVDLKLVLIAPVLESLQEERHAQRASELAQTASIPTLNFIRAINSKFHSKLFNAIKFSGAKMKSLRIDRKKKKTGNNGENLDLYINRLTPRRTAKKKKSNQINGWKKEHWSLSPHMLKCSSLGKLCTVSDHRPGE